MTSAIELLDRLRSLDVRLSLDGDRLKCSAPKGVLTAELKAELADCKNELLELLSAEAAKAVAHGSHDRRLSPAQRRLWFLQQYEPDNCAYNIGLAFEVTGHLQVATLQRAFQQTIARHEALRTCFTSADGVPTASVAADVPFILETELVGEHPHEGLAVRFKALVSEPFKLSEAPLYRVRVHQLAPDRHALLLVIHHIIADGWSLSILLADTFAEYERLVAGGAVQETSAVSDISSFQPDAADPAESRQRLAWWRKQLDPLPTVIDLPLDRPRPPLMTVNGARRRFDLSPECTADVIAFARKERVTPFIVLFAAYVVLMQRYSGQEDVVVGSAFAGRDRPETERAIGLFINTLVLRTSLTGEPTVRELLHRVRETLLDAAAHDVPFDELVASLNLSRHLNHAPLVQTMFTLQTFPMPRLQLADVTVAPLRLEAGTARFDLSVEGCELDGAFAFDFEYNTDLFDEATVTGLQQHFGELVSALIADAERPVSLLEMRSSEERAAFLATALATKMDYPSDRRVSDLIAESLSASPDRVAVRDGARTLSSSALLAHAKGLANTLRERGIAAGDLVGICVDRSVDMPIALLGVLMAGAAYVPLDPQYPVERLTYMLEDSGARAVVAHREFEDRLPLDRIPAIWLDAGAPVPDARPLTSVPGDGESLAYVIYTSGSTGRPKGVEITHRSLVNFLLAMKQRPGLTADDRLLAVTTLCFDIAGLEMYLPLLCGAELVIAPRAATADPLALSDIIRREAITTMQATPATWRMLLESGWTGQPGFRVFCGGEALPRELAEKLLAGGAEVWNLYGPTETTIWSTVERVKSEAGPVLVGTPIANTTTYVLDGHRRLVPTGVVGELWIGGDGVARRYRGRPDLTDAAFAPDPFFPGQRMYRTGDLARWRRDGRLELLGRMDGQIKLRGFRIELGEIEAALQQQPGVSHAVVKLDGSGESQRLVGYVTAKAGAQISGDEIKAAVVRFLPEYMVPAVVEILDRFPLTPNGKVDKKALPAPRAQRKVSSYAPPSDAVEEEVANLWAALLRVPQVSPHDNFFDLGGHSLLLVQMQSRLRSRFGRDVTLLELFQRPTVSALARLLRTETMTATGANA